jgi:hypothetical protein
LGGFTLLPFQDQLEQWWYVSPFSGNLIKSTHRPLFFDKRSHKINSALDLCVDPYGCEWSPERNIVNPSKEVRLQIFNANRLFFQLGNRNFFLSVLYSKIRIPIFEKTQDAFSFIAELDGHKNEIADRCLQRSLLAAKISKSFKEKGVILIGAEISSGEMHAWILEDNCQPDFEDRSWINYRPLLAITA